VAEYTVITKDLEYIPTWDGNNEKPEPIKFTLRYLTNAERSRCFAIHADRRGGIDVEPDNELLIKLGVVKIEGFKVNKKSIETAAQFQELRGFDRLYAEVATEILTMNAREDTDPLP
jgi:hypothetical protein